MENIFITKDWTLCTRLSKPWWLSFWEGLPTESEDFCLYIFYWIYSIHSLSLVEIPNIRPRSGSPLDSVKGQDTVSSASVDLSRLNIAATVCLLPLISLLSFLLLQYQVHLLNCVSISLPVRSVTTDYFSANFIVENKRSWILICSGAQNTDAVISTASVSDNIILCFEVVLGHQTKFQWSKFWTWPSSQW